MVTMTGRVDPRFAERLRWLLVERGLSYRRLADQVFYAKSTIHDPGDRP
jgi:hypothetical protein